MFSMQQKKHTKTPEYCRIIAFSCPFHNLYKLQVPWIQDQLHAEPFRQTQSLRLRW